MKTNKKKKASEIYKILCDSDFEQVFKALIKYELEFSSQCYKIPLNSSKLHRAFIDYINFNLPYAENINDARYLIADNQEIREYFNEFRIN